MQSAANLWPGSHLERVPPAATPRSRKQGRRQFRRSPARRRYPGPTGPVNAAVVGLAGHVLFAIFGAVVLHYDWPLVMMGRAVRGVRNLLARGHRPPLTGLDRRLLDERDAVKSVWGRNVGKNVPGGSVAGR